MKNYCYLFKKYLIALTAIAIWSVLILPDAKAQISRVSESNTGEINSHTSGSTSDMAKIDSEIYVNTDANYGFRIISGNTILFSQEEIVQADGKTRIYFNQEEAKIAAEFLIDQIRQGKSPSQIDYQTWLQINN